MKCPSPTPGCQAQGYYAGKRSLHNIWLCKSARILPIPVRWNVTGNLDIILKGLYTDSLACNHSPLALVKDSNSKVARDIQGKTEVCGCQAKASRTTIIIPVWNSPHIQPSGRYHYSCVEPSTTWPNLRPQWPGELHIWTTQVSPWNHALSSLCSNAGDTLSFQEASQAVEGFPSSGWHRVACETSWETLVAGFQPQLAVQLSFGGSRESTGPR